MSQKDRLQVPEGSWTVSRSRRKKLSIRNVPINWEKMGILFGVKDSFIRKLATKPGVSNIYLDADKSVIVIKGSSDTAIGQVEDMIISKMETSHLRPRYSDCKPIKLIIEDNAGCRTNFVFENSFSVYFDTKTFCSIFGVRIDLDRYAENGFRYSSRHISEEKLVQMRKVEEIWNKNASFVDTEEIWKRARTISMPSSNFIAGVLVTSDFLRHRWTQNELIRCRRRPGIDYISISDDFNEEDLIMNLEVGSKTQDQLDGCMARLFSMLSEFHENSKIYPLGSFENVDPGLLFRIPYTTYNLGSSFYSFRLNDRNFEQTMNNIRPNLGYLQTLYDTDPEVIFVELNEIEHLITLGCTSHKRLNRLQFEVRGHLSFFKSYGWRKTYHGNFRTHVKVSCSQRNMIASFHDVSLQTKPFLAADFVDFVPNSSSLCFIKLVLPSDSNTRFLHYDPYSSGTYTLYDESSMVAKVRGFLSIDDFSTLHNVQTFIRFGVTRFRVDKSKDEFKPVSTLIDFWEENFNALFSFDLLNLYKDDFEAYLTAKGFSFIDKHSFTKCYFNDVVNNLRFTASVSGENISLESKLEYSRCKTDHIHYLVVNIDSSKCSYEIIVSSQKPCENTRAKEFVEESIRSGELLKENVMSLNSYYSMYNVSVVDRSVFQYKNFIIHLDVVSKKSNQRYGKFSNVVNLTLHYPQLNKSIEDLQGNTNNESLKNSIVELSKELIFAGDYISNIICGYIESTL